MFVYQCEDSLEGIFTAIYNIYEDRRDPVDTRVSLTDELFLFAEYIPVETDPEKALKVIRTLKRRFGEGDYESICYALSTPSEEKAHLVYQTVALGLGSRCASGHLFDNLANYSVNGVFSLSRRAGRECHRFLEFVRFQELESGLLFSRIGPENNLITFLMPHFADRLPAENFVIYDETNGLFGIHPSLKEWFVLQSRDFSAEEILQNLSERERAIQELFRHFCHKIAIEERKNLKLQRQMLPLRFQEYMVEFDKIQ